MTHMVFSLQIPKPNASLLLSFSDVNDQKFSRTQSVTLTRLRVVVQDFNIFKESMTFQQSQTRMIRGLEEKRIRTHQADNYERQRRKLRWFSFRLSVCFLFCQRKKSWHSAIWNLAKLIWNLAVETPALWSFSQVRLKHRTGFRGSFPNVFVPWKSET